MDISGAASVGIWFQRLLIELRLIQSTKCVREDNKANVRQHNPNLSAQQ